MIADTAAQRRSIDQIGMALIGKMGTPHRFIAIVPIKRHGGDSFAVGEALTRTLTSKGVGTRLADFFQGTLRLGVIPTVGPYLRALDRHRGQLSRNQPRNAGADGERGRERDAVTVARGAGGTPAGQLRIRRLASPEPGRTLALAWRRGSALRQPLAALAETIRMTLRDGKKKS